MIKPRPFYFVLFGLICTSALTQSCRTAMRTEKEIGNPSPIEIRVANLNTADRDRSELLFLLSGCGVGNASGTRVKDTKPGTTLILFESQNVKINDLCDLQVLSDNPKSTAQNWFGDAGVMYSAKNIKIGLSSGKLSGVAILQQVYSPTTDALPTEQLWKLSAATKTPSPLTGLCTCSVTCSPTLPNSIAKLEIGSDKTSGTCLFVNLIDPALATASCSKLTVQCDSEIFAGEWPAGTMVDGHGAKDAALPDILLSIITANQNVDSVIDVTLPTK